jgi:AAA family ATPase
VNASRSTCDTTDRCVLSCRYEGDAERAVTKIFSEAAARAPCCILIDNIDLLCYSRTAPGASELQKRIVSCLLTLMDGVSSGAEALPGVASQGNDDRYCDFISVWVHQVVVV